MNIDPISKIDFLNNLRENKNYLYKNIDNNNDKKVVKYGCRILIILNIIHISIIYIGILCAIFFKNKNNLKILLISFILFYILAFYSSGCWISFPEIILNNKYKCTDNYIVSKYLWIIRDILLPNVTTTMLLYIPITIFIIYKILI